MERLESTSSRRNLTSFSNSAELNEANFPEPPRNIFRNHDCIPDPFLMMKQKLKIFWRKQTIFLLFVFIAVGTGVGLGLYLNPSINEYSIILTSKQQYYLEFPGLIFLRMMSLLVVPLAVCSNISSLSSLNFKSARFMGALSMVCFFVTNLLATTVGMIFVVIITPGYYGDVMIAALRTLNNETGRNRLDLDETLMGFMLNLMPANLFTSTFEKTKLEVVISNDGEPNFNPGAERGANMFGLLCFSIMLGLSLQRLGPSTVVSHFFQECRQGLIWIVSVLLWYFPIGVASLVGGQIAKTHDLKAAMVKMAMYVATMCGALVTQFCLLNILFLVITRKSPFKLFYDMLAALICGMGTASSSGSLPVTLKCLRRASYTNINVVRFLLPLGMTLNMNGTAILEAVGPVFLMQCIGMHVKVSDALLVIFSAYLATMVTGTIPSGGLLTMIISLDALKIPTSLIALMMPVDWLLDRLRTPLNVYGNAVATGIVSHYLDAQEAKRSAKGEQLQNSETRINITACSVLSALEISECAQSQQTNAEISQSQTSSDSGFQDIREELEDQEILDRVVYKF